MKSEVPILNTDGTVLESQKHLIEQLQREAEQGTVGVNLYRGPEEYGSEAFYTLSDGTVLHEVNGTAEDGSDYRTISLVLEEEGRSTARRLIQRLRSIHLPG